MPYQAQINKLRKQSKSVIEEILKKQSLQLNLKNKQEHLFNMLLMISNNYLSLNGNIDTNFSFIIEILSDKKTFKMIKKHFEKLLQTAVQNKNTALIIALYIKHLSNLQIKTLNETELLNETRLSMNIKSNLNEEGEEIFEKILVPYLNVLIFSIKDDKEETIEILNMNLQTLFNNLNEFVDKKNDFIFISDYIFNDLKKKKILI